MKEGGCWSLSGNVWRVLFCAVIQVIAIPAVMSMLPDFWQWLSVEFSPWLYFVVWFAEACVAAIALCVGMGMGLTRANVVLFLTVDASCLLSSLIIWLTVASKI